MDLTEAQLAAMLAPIGGLIGLTILRWCKKSFDQWSSARYEVGGSLLYCLGYWFGDLWAAGKKAINYLCRRLRVN